MDMKNATLLFSIRGNPTWRGLRRVCNTAKHSVVIFYRNKLGWRHCVGACSYVFSADLQKNNCENNGSLDTPCKINL
jgi:hypothetical protein